VKRMTFLELAQRVLSEQQRPLAPSEIWKIAVSKGYDRGVSAQGKTPAQTLYSAIFLNERDNPDTIFVKYNTRPARYYIKALAQQTKDENLEGQAASEPIIPSVISYRESQLHAFLSYFASQRFNARSKTIRHYVDIKRGFGEWVHLDMIAISYPNWEIELGKLSQQFGDVGVKLYSFEIKKELSFTNLREAFFQAVSNSSWAHEGYLVAADISTDQDFREELHRLARSFSIGIIELDIEDPDSSEVLIPSKGRETVDWEALNKLAQMNRDTIELLIDINNAIKIKDFKYGAYDPSSRPEPLGSASPVGSGDA
jgi:hypothetical protein